MVSEFTKYKYPEKEANLRTFDVQTQKSFQLQGASLPETLTRMSLDLTGGPSQTPIRGSRWPFNPTVPLP